MIYARFIAMLIASMICLITPILVVLGIGGLGADSGMRRAMRECRLQKCADCWYFVGWRSVATTCDNDADTPHRKPMLAEKRKTNA